MNTYIARTLFDGYKINKKTSDKFVGVPKKKLGSNCMVMFGGEYMVIPKGTTPEHTQIFPDKFGRGTYTLCYYKWDGKTKHE